MAFQNSQLVCGQGNRVDDLFGFSKVRRTSPNLSLHVDSNPFTENASKDVLPLDSCSSCGSQGDCKLPDCKMKEKILTQITEPLVIK